jgi:hypothetical protein
MRIQVMRHRLATVVDKAFDRDDARRREANRVVFHVG